MKEKKLTDAQRQVLRAIRAVRKACKKLDEVPLGEGKIVMMCSEHVTEEQVKEMMAMQGEPERVFVEPIRSDFTLSDVL